MVVQTYEHYKVKKKLGIMLRRFFTTDFPCKKIRRYLDLDKSAFCAYVSAQLRDGMTLENYGEFWVFDHIVPLFLFDHADDAELKVAWNYVNVVPMPLMLNRLKGVSVEFSQEELSKRMKFLPYNPVLPLLKARMDIFSGLMQQLVSNDRQLHKIAKITYAKVTESS